MFYLSEKPVVSSPGDLALLTLDNRRMNTKKKFDVTVTDLLKQNFWGKVLSHYTILRHISVGTEAGSPQQEAVY